MPRGVTTLVDTLSGPSVLEIFGAMVTVSNPSPVGRMPPSREYTHSPTPKIPQFFDFAHAWNNAPEKAENGGLPTPPQSQA